MILAAKACDHHWDIEYFSQVNRSTDDVVAMKGHRSPRLRLALIICGVAVFAIGVILLGNSFAPGFLQAARCTPAVRKLDPSCDIPPKPQEPLFHVAGVFLLVGATVGVLGIGSSLLEILRRRRSMRGQIS